MANAKLFPLSLFFLSLSLHLALSDTPSPSPSPSPSVHAPNPAPASSPLGSPSPSPGSSQAESSNADEDDRAENSSRGGLNWFKKAGLVVGVIVAVSVIIMAGMVYKMRKQNMRRSQYAYAVRREIL
ncbi:hypothetical protein PHAVU_005G135700 [Phaseolus vulgaris]|uniref:Uncharacterized protein n=1 Tax=Phaseolus vulgaris TaxID=3885 RepID=V7BYR9_PHAVU|nr:hypothetical protein PHAVU_005G135700g [Phaseolus vulgaris]ESW22203.1 hypothetical protein PHAVU_005G135700g [Phaseolus vulgaris]